MLGGVSCVGGGGSMSSCGKGICASTMLWSVSCPVISQMVVVEVLGNSVRFVKISSILLEESSVAPFLHVYCRTLLGLGGSSGLRPIDFILF